METVLLMVVAAAVGIAVAVRLPVPPVTPVETGEDFDGDGGWVSWPTLRTLLLLALATVYTAWSEHTAAVVLAVAALVLLEVEDLAVDRRQRCLEPAPSLAGTGITSSPCWLPSGHKGDHRTVDGMTWQAAVR